jgi:hypothetical protein
MSERATKPLIPLTSETDYDPTAMGFPLITSADKSHTVLFFDSPCESTYMSTAPARNQKHFPKFIIVILWYYFPIQSTLFKQDH